MATFVFAWETQLSRPRFERCRNKNTLLNEAITELITQVAHKYARGVTPIRELIKNWTYLQDSSISSILTNGTQRGVPFREILSPT